MEFCATITTVHVCAKKSRRELLPSPVNLCDEISGERALVDSCDTLFDSKEGGGALWPQDYDQSVAASSANASFRPDFDNGARESSA